MRDPAFPGSILWAAVAAASLAPVAAFATDYMNIAAAQKVMFPDATSFTPHQVLLTAEQSARLKVRAGDHPVTAFMHVTAAMAGDHLLGYVIADSVIGKFELIDYAVALDPAGAILDIEILSYREAHGGEVRTAAWRKQFVGKNAGAPIAIGDDIANISGATLSCTHLTDGVRRIVAYAQLALGKP